MLIEEVIAILGRRPNTDELKFIKSVMASKQIQYPYPALNSFITGNEQGSAKNGRLIIGLEGKNNIIRTKARMQCAAQGGAAQLKISFPNANFLVGDRINSEHRKPVPGDKLIYLKAAADAEATLLNVWNEVPLGAVTVVNPGGLGASILSLCAEQELGVTYGTIKATVLLETILAAFEIEEILYELREHMAGINAGRWDYMFSAIKKFRHEPGFLWPDRAQVTMTAPMMRAYTELLVQTCHKRGAHAIGGMAAFIPNRRDAEVTRVALAKVKEDKEREAQDGFDGSWVAHPDLVPVCTDVFSKSFEEGKVNQIHRLREDVQVTPEMMLDFKIPGGKITEPGLRNNISVGIQYISAWLKGTGAVAIFNLMEDAATAEIARSQVWQWIQHSEGKLDDGRQITLEMVQTMIPEELAKIREAYGKAYDEEKMNQATDLFTSLVSGDNFEEFLTIRAYDQLD